MPLWQNSRTKFLIPPAKECPIYASQTLILIHGICSNTITVYLEPFVSLKVYHRLVELTSQPHIASLHQIYRPKHHYKSLITYN